MNSIETVFVVVIPGKKEPDGSPWRSDNNSSYFKDIGGAEYCAKINGGYKKYHFIEERYWINYPGTKKRSHVGNIKKIHHYNQDHQKQITYG